MEAGADIDRKLQFLLDHAREAQKRMSAIEHSIEDLPPKWRADVDEARTELLDAIEAKLTQERDYYIGSRIAGFVLLAFGIPLVFAANFID